MISLVNVSKEYHLDGLNSITPIRNVNLEIGEGEFLMIVGRSGSGKTTLLNLCAGLIRPTTGQVLFDGTDIQTLNDKQVSILRNQKIGFIFQFQSLLPNLTVLENVAMPAAASDNVKGNPFQRAAELLTTVGLGERMQVHPRQLSAGELRRVAIARALMNQPSTLLADEPTADLDAQTEIKIMALLRQINQSGITIVMITHNLNLINYAHRAFLVENGELKPVNIGEFAVQPANAETAQYLGVASGSRPESSSPQVVPDAKDIPQPAVPSLANPSRFHPATFGLAVLGVVLGAFAVGFSLAGALTPSAAPSAIVQTAANSQNAPISLAARTLTDLDIVRQYDSISANLNAIISFESLGTVLDSSVDLKVPTGPISWSGTSFRGGVTRDDITDEISGTLSPDGSTLLSLVYSRRVSQAGSDNGVFYRVTLQDLPLVLVKTGNANSLKPFSVTGADVEKYVVSVEYLEGSLSGDQTASTVVKSVDWSNPTFPPVLKVNFSNLVDLAEDPYMVPKPGLMDAGSMQ